MPNDSLMIALS